MKENILALAHVLPKLYFEYTQQAISVNINVLLGHEDEYTTHGIDLMQLHTYETHQSFEQ